jgi:arsenical pump membrane protein
VFVFGTSSALLSNVLNNIPMTVMYTQLISSLSGKAVTNAVYATVIGSNIGAYFTPFGALAGIMWMSILKHKKIALSYSEFIKYGLLTGTIVLLGSLAALSIVLR